jgi:hypothetical protein
LSRDISLVLEFQILATNFEPHAPYSVVYHYPFNILQVEVMFELGVRVEGHKPLGLLHENGLHGFYEQSAANTSYAFARKAGLVIKVS